MIIETTCWTSPVDNFSASRRASWSGAPPAESGTTSLTGRAGYDCAQAFEAVTARAAAAAMSARIFMRASIAEEAAVALCCEGNIATGVSLAVVPIAAKLEDRIQC
jgi:hypothetical protein